MLQADSLIDAQPDSALHLLESRLADKDAWPRAQRMRYELLRAKAMNKAYVPFTTDSVMLQVADYYDGGDPNDAMLAHYLLGCVYRDLGEAPAAVESFQKAIACADTVRQDCNYKILSSTYSQMADAFYKELLLSEALEARKKAQHYAMLSKDTIIAISEMKLSSGVYILLNQLDSAEELLYEVVRLYKQKNREQDAINALPLLMHLYIDQPSRQQELKQFIDLYDAECVQFDKQHNLPPQKRKFFYYKGRYFENAGLVDSAEFYYRKEHRENMPLSAKNSMYKGLLNVYSKRHVADSISKYARLYCEVNDSSISIKDRELTAQLAASYQYNRIRKEALKNEADATMAKFQLMMLFIVFAFLITVGIVLFVRIRKRHLQRFAKIKELYAETMERYQKNVHSMQLLESIHQNTIDSLSLQYRTNIEELQAENEGLKTCINELKNSKDLQKHAEISKEFFESQIVTIIRNKANRQKYEMNDNEWNELTTKAGECFPLLIKHLRKIENATPQKTRTCILVILQLRTDQIAYLLQVIPQRITNIKREINKALFNNPSARSLYSSLIQEYNIIA